MNFHPAARWIGSAHPFDLQQVYLNFRRAFSLPNSPQHVSLWITADSRYKLWLNGNFVARGPARCYPHAQSVDELNVTKYLKRGENVIAVQVYQPGYSHFAYVHRGAAGLLAQLTGADEIICFTDPQWRVQRDSSFDSLVPRVSIYGSGVEKRDMHLDEPWQTPMYDDSQWASPRVVAPVNGSPWTGTFPRELPSLMEGERPLMLLETRMGKTILNSDAHLAHRAGWFQAQPRPIEKDADGGFRVSLPEGESAFWLFDLGRDFVGQGWVEIENASGQEWLAVSYHEKIRAGQLVISDPQTYCRVRLTDSFQLRTGSQIAETFALRGGRYVLFQLNGPAQAARLRFHFRTSEYPLVVSKPLTTSDPELNDIIKMCEDTMCACLQDGFIDSTWRESSQWTGDALTHALILSSMSDDTRPLKRVIEMAAQDPYPDGVLPSVLPGEVHAYTVVDYNFMWVELLALYWEITHDAAFVQPVWTTLVKMLDRFDQDLNADGLIFSQPGRRLFLDWSPQSRNEPSAVYNLHYLLALRGAANLAREMNQIENARTWTERADALTRAVRAAFWDNGCWHDDLPRTTYSQLAAALAILTHTARQDEIPALLDALVARSLDDDDAPLPDKMVLASPFMHHYIFEALRAYGREDAVIQIIKLRWGRWTRAGYPTTWENWSVDFPDGSQCHAFSAHPRYHLAQILSLSFSFDSTTFRSGGGRGATGEG